MLSHRRRDVDGESALLDARRYVREAREQLRVTVADDSRIRHVVEELRELQLGHLVKNSLSNVVKESVR